MKVLPFKIPKPELNAVVFQEDKGKTFFNKLHQHEEIQISLILSGDGNLIVGDTINRYKDGDIFVIGSNIPHVFNSDTPMKIQSRMFTVFFSKQLLGDAFLELNELREVSNFFKRSEYGFKINSKKRWATDLILKTETATQLERLIILIQLLKVGSEARYTPLSSFIYNKNYNDNEGNRMRNVYDYTMNHYKNAITLKTIANVANMTKNAFCKYFKKRTNKTYVTFLNEIRVEHATRLLEKQSDLAIVEIAELSGFQNLSNFNRQYKRVKGYAPSYVRKKN
ncbi:AraC family transcriptional regulator [Seonamhaeicola aphaedonensis]|uniref:AraC family transcriptional regulator n=1 Tax=Seonamhaeicola aphaedonensis TaxID=1461338 RepID=A0A3D9HLE4_9FLAO|nr:helix-turn-helix transcriptional regulator [Seonamhaeicola aphaedonensis]RED50317.1 AraC family transcriptional regulator [Seonamhaeicola aphaedonensis]